MFGQAHLFDAAVDEPMASRYGKDKRLCASCAGPYDPHRKAREKKAEQAYTERVSVGQEYLKSYYEKRQP